jgi:hypothetical protein
VRPIDSIIGFFYFPSTEKITKTFTPLHAHSRALYMFSLGVSGLGKSSPRADSKKGKKKSSELMNLIFKQFLYTKFNADFAAGRK